MSKKPVNKEALAAIVEATKAGGHVFTSADIHQPMIAAGLVEVNTAMANPANPAEYATRAKAEAMTEAPAAASAYQVFNGAILPPSKRRGGSSTGAPTKYPFATMEVGSFFFEPNSNHAKGDAVKALGSTISAQNNKFSEPTGEIKTITRAVRDEDNKAKLDADGNKVMETVQLPVKKYNRKFTIRPVEAGYAMGGGYAAPSAGAMIVRTI